MQGRENFIACKDVSMTLHAKNVVWHCMQGMDHAKKWIWQCIQGREHDIAYKGALHCIQRMKRINSCKEGSITMHAKNVAWHCMQGRDHTKKGTWQCMQEREHEIACKGAWYCMQLHCTTLHATQQALQCMQCSMTIHAKGTWHCLKGVWHCMQAREHDTAH